MKRVILWGLLLFFLISDTKSEWIKEDIHNCRAPLYDIEIGDAKGDGKQKVYVATGSTIYEFLWKGDSWKKEEVGFVRGQYVKDIVIGDGRGDGKNRIYAAYSNGHIYEFEWTGNKWNMVDVGKGGSDPLGGIDMNGVAVGDARGDGKNRIYGACADKNVYEFEWNGKSFVKRIVGKGKYQWSYMRCVFIGDVKGDGKKRIYVGSQDRSVYEFEWKGGKWIQKKIGSAGGRLYKLIIGDGKGDGKKRIYVASADYGIYEFEWSKGSWKKTLLGKATDDMFSVSIGDARGDGKIRVYGASDDGKVYEFEWKKERWIKNIILTFNRPLYTIAVYKSFLFVGGDNRHLYRLKLKK